MMLAELFDFQQKLEINTRVSIYISKYCNKRKQNSPYTFSIHIVSLSKRREICANNNPVPNFTFLFHDLFKKNNKIIHSYNHNI